MNQDSHAVKPEASGLTVAEQMLPMVMEGIAATLRSYGWLNAYAHRAPGVLSIRRQPVAPESSMALPTLALYSGPASPIGDPAAVAFMVRTAGRGVGADDAAFANPVDAMRSAVAYLRDLPTRERALWKRPLNIAELPVGGVLRVSDGDADDELPVPKIAIEEEPFLEVGRVAACHIRTSGRNVVFDEERAELRNPDTGEVIAVCTAAGSWLVSPPSVAVDDELLVTHVLLALRKAPEVVQEEWSLAPDVGLGVAEEDAAPATPRARDLLQVERAMVVVAHYVVERLRVEPHLSIDALLGTHCSLNLAERIRRCGLGS